MADDSRYFETDESGKIKQKFDDDEFVSAVKEHQPASTKEVAETVGCERQTADYRLRQLADDDSITKKMVGNSLAWSVTQSD